MKREKFLSHGSKKFLLKTITFTKWPTYCCHQHHCNPIFNKTFMLTYVHMLHMMFHLLHSDFIFHTLWKLDCHSMLLSRISRFQWGFKTVVRKCQKVFGRKKWLCSSCSAHSNYFRAELWYLKLFDFQRFLSLKTESKVELIKSLKKCLNTEFIDFVIRILTPFWISVR